MNWLHFSFHHTMFNGYSITQMNCCQDRRRQRDAIALSKIAFHFKNRLFYISGGLAAISISHYYSGALPPHSSNMRLSNNRSPPLSLYLHLMLWDDGKRSNKKKKCIFERIRREERNVLVSLS